MYNYDRFFVKNVTELFKPLYTLLQKDKKIIWTDEAEKALKNIKKIWCEELELLLPNLESDFVLETDASDIDLGAVLKQDKKIVAYASRSLSSSERNYGITEREVLGEFLEWKNLNFF